MWPCRLMSSPCQSSSFLYVSVCLFVCVCAVADKAGFFWFFGFFAPSRFTMGQPRDGPLHPPLARRLQNERCRSPLSLASPRIPFHSLPLPFLFWDYGLRAAGLDWSDHVTSGRIRGSAVGVVALVVCWCWTYILR